MSHKSGGVIINAIDPCPALTQEQKTKLSEIKTRDEYTFADRVYLAAVVMQIADDSID